MTVEKMNDKLLEALNDVADELEEIGENQGDTENDNFYADDALIGFFENIKEVSDDEFVGYAAARIVEAFRGLPKWYA